MVDKGIFICLLYICFSLNLNGCASFTGDRLWREDATISPGWQNIQNAAYTAMRSPDTWVPLAVGLVLQIEDMDERISDWASDNTPLFGSTENADNASDHLRTAAGVAYFATAFTASSGKERKEWMGNKLKGLSIGGAAVLSTWGATRLFKKTTGRIRPDESDDESFISGHTSTASSFTTLARKNLDFVQLSKKKKVLLKAVFTGISASTGWARVEAKKHFLSDVLVGYALGYLISATINDAFVSDKYKEKMHLRIEPSREETFVGISLIY